MDSFAKKDSLTFCHVRYESFSTYSWVSEYTGKFTGVCSTASLILLSVLSFEAIPLGAMVTMIVGEKCSTTMVPVG